ncbi:MAG: hypothetical protein HYR70_10555 [Chloroflexi bacterium]|nr:hypothetical protein [Chloroflexota bacterium]MBI3340350.1 hypothetical protein [Chloroflexota bacterium]
MDAKSSTATIQSTNSDKASLILTFCAMGVLMVFLVYSRNFAFGSKQGNWVYPYFNKITSIPLWIPILVFLLLGLSIFIGSRLIFFHEKTTLFGSFLIIVFIQLLIRNIYPVSLGTIVQSDNATSFYSVAMRYSPVETLTQYDALVLSFPLHAVSNMPGKILLFELFKLFTLSPQIMGYLVVLLSTFGALPLYGICKKLFHDKKAAFYAFMLYALIPSRLFFFPLLNTVTPLFILLCLYLFLIYIEGKNLLFLWLLGAALYILILFEPSPLVTGIIFIGILINAAGEKKLSKKDFGALLIIPLLAFLGMYTLFSVLFSFDLIQVLRFVVRDAVNFNFKDNRGYWVWIGENTKEFFYGVGTPIMLIFIYWISQLLMKWKNLKYNVIYWSMENIFVLSLLMTFGAVVFLGINRGEVSRLWIYLAVFFQIPASLFIAKIPKSTVLFFLVTSTLVLQSIVALQRVGFIIP